MEMEKKIRTFYIIEVELDNGKKGYIGENYNYEFPSNDMPYEFTTYFHRAATWNDFTNENLKSIRQKCREKGQITKATVLKVTETITTEIEVANCDNSWVRG